LHPLLQYRPLHGAAHRILFLVTNVTEATEHRRLTAALTELQHTYRQHGYGRLALPITTIQLGDNPGDTPLSKLAHTLRSHLNDHGSDGRNEQGNLVMVALERGATDGDGDTDVMGPVTLAACQSGTPERLALVTAAMVLPQALLRGTWAQPTLDKLALRAYQSLGRPPSKPSAPNAATLSLRPLTLAPAQHDVSMLEVHGTELRFQARLHVLHCAIVANLAQEPARAVLCFTDAHGELLECVEVDASEGSNPAERWSIVANTCWQHTQHIVRQTGLHWHLVIALQKWNSAADVAIKRAHLLDAFACEDYSVLSVNVLSLASEVDVRLSDSFLRQAPSGLAVLHAPWQRLGRGLVVEPCLQAMAWSSTAVVQVRMHWRLCVSGMQGRYSLEQSEVDAMLYLVKAYFSLSQLQPSQGLKAGRPFEPLHLSLACHRLSTL
jgi:hypothetical protein